MTDKPLWKDEAHKERAMNILDVLGGLAQVPYKTIEQIKEEIKSQPYESHRSVPSISR